MVVPKIEKGPVSIMVSDMPPVYYLSFKIFDFGFMKCLQVGLVCVNVNQFNPPIHCIHFSVFIDTILLLYRRHLALIFASLCIAWNAL